MQPDDPATLLDIAHALGLILEFKAGLNREAFMADRKTQAAILHEMTILGEAVKRLSDGFRNAHPEIPWRRMAGLRDKLVHAYNRVDLDEVWRIAESDVPEAALRIAPLLPREET